MRIQMTLPTVGAGFWDKLCCLLVCHSLLYTNSYYYYHTNSMWGEAETIPSLSGTLGLWDSNIIPFPRKLSLDFEQGAGSTWNMNQNMVLNTSFSVVLWGSPYTIQYTVFSMAEKVLQDAIDTWRRLELLSYQTPTGHFFRYGLSHKDCSNSNTQGGSSPLKIFYLDRCSVPAFLQSDLALPTHPSSCMSAFPNFLRKLLVWFGRHFISPLGGRQAAGASQETIWSSNFYAFQDSGPRWQEGFTFNELSQGFTWLPCSDFCSLWHTVSPASTILGVDRGCQQWSRAYKASAGMCLTSTHCWLLQACPEGLPLLPLERRYFETLSN